MCFKEDIFQEKSRKVIGSKGCEDLLGGQSFGVESQRDSMDPKLPAVFWNLQNIQFSSQGTNHEQLLRQCSEYGKFRAKYSLQKRNIGSSECHSRK